MTQATDEEIVEAMARVIDPRAWLKVQDVVAGAAQRLDKRMSLKYARAALAVARPMIERAGRETALEEAAEICWNASSCLLARDAILDLKDKPQ